MSGPHARDERGASLLELLVASLIISLLLGALYSVLFYTQATIESQQDLMELRQQARVALSQLTTEIRMAGYDLGSVPEPILEAHANRLVFAADIDAGSAETPCDAASENAAGGGAERVDYRVVAGWLVRTVDCWNGAAWANAYTNQRLAENVITEEPIFQYLDGAGNALPVGAGGLTGQQRADVRSIIITLLLEHPDEQVLGREHVRYRIQEQLGVRNNGG